MDRVEDILGQIGQGTTEVVAALGADVVESTEWSWMWAIGVAVIAYVAYRLFMRETGTSKQKESEKISE